jgi:proteasome assembly chaperone (PAC2) family protein
MTSEHLKIEHLPELRSPALVAAFQGWPDAGEAASGAVRYLIRNLATTRFAELRPEEFYVFTRERPYSIEIQPGRRRIRWPANEFHSWRDPTEQRDLVLLIGREPNLRWETYTNAILDLAEQCGVTLLVTLGGTYDAVSHHGEVTVSGLGSTPRLRHQLETMGVMGSGYQGPTSVHSALLETARRRRLRTASLWGHAPHYIQAVPNVKVCYGMLDKLKALLGLSLDLDELRGASQALEARVDEVLANNEELQRYVKRLDQGIVDKDPPDEVADLADEEPAGEIPSSDVVLRELEAFLRQSRQEAIDDDSEEEHGGRT